MSAINMGHVKIVKLLLDRGAQINIQDLSRGYTALMFASFDGHIECAQLLLDKGDRIYIKNVYGETAKSLAEEMGHDDTVHLINEYDRGEADELGLEPLNNALEEENKRLMTENEILKEREICKQELLDEYKTRSKSVEEEIQRAKDEIQRFRDEISSLKEEKIAMRVEIEYLKRREEESRLERNTERAMFQTMISSLTNGLEDRERKRNEDQVESS